MFLLSVIHCHTVCYDRKMNKPVVNIRLFFFCHGAGERGSDNEKQLTHGAQMFLNPVNREKYPAFVLIPQCPADAYWAYTSRPASFFPGRDACGTGHISDIQIIEGVIG